MQIKELYKKFLKAKGADIKYRNLAAGKKIDVSKKGLWDKKKKQVIVPSNRITMKGPNGEQDFFKKPVVATGLQSGQQVMMQPGGEYYFPNDKAVHEVRMQNGGNILSMGDYDLTTAPKKGDYLLPDINRPSYIDDAGERRTEYKIGINVDGKETLIPTVVGGRQLTEDEARDRYRKTGLHMGQFNTPEEADYAARLRTARYKMLEDPINFQANQFQVGGTLPPIYTSNPNDPRIRSYKDSLSLYKDYTNPIEISKIFKKIKSDPALRYYRSRSAEELNNFPGKIKPISGTEWNYSKLLSDFNSGKNIAYSYYPFYDERGVLSPTKRGTHLSFKKPVQPYIYKKPEVSPIYTSNINDPRLRSYRDSLNLYNSSKYIKEHPLVGNYMPGIEHGRQMDINTDNQNVNKYKPKLALTNTGYYYNYKKPVQPYIYKKPEVVPEVVETPVAPAPVVEPPKPSLFVSNIDRDMYTPNGGMAREYNIGVTLQDGSKKAFRTEKEYQDWKAANNLDISKAKVSEGRGYSYNYPENKKYGGWLDEFQEGGSVQTDITTPIRKKPSPSQDAFNAMLDEYEASKEVPEEDASVPEDMGFQSGGELPVVIDSLFSNFRSGIGRKYAQQGMAVPGVNGTVVANTNAPVAEKLKKAMEEGGELKEEEDDDDKDMVNGVASILRRVKNPENRLQLANQLSKQFNREKVKYDLPSFLAKSKVNK